MLKSRLIAPALLALLLAGFGLGVVSLFQLRFNAGDIYPPYSSLRADPLGAKALYESLQGIPSLAVGRFYQPSAKLAGGRQRVLLIFGVHRIDLREMPEDDFRAVQAWLFSGGRVVVSLVPATMEEMRGREFKIPPARKGRSPRADTNDVEDAVKTISFYDKLGLRLQSDDLFIPDAAASRAELAESSPAKDGLPASISWHSSAYFEDLDASWRVLYQRRKHAVIMERSFGPGTLVLASDSYFVSNEALRRERHPALLAWLIGGHREILFDETHLGVEENPGVAALLRRYRLQGFLLGLLLVGGLFVWQNSAPLVPPFRDEPTEGGTPLVVGRQSTAGFVSLLRRSIPPAQILTVCVAEWKAACARDPRAAARLPAVEKNHGGGASPSVRFAPARRGLASHSPHSNPKRIRRPQLYEYNRGPTQRNPRRHPPGSRQGHHRPERCY